MLKLMDKKILTIYNSLILDMLRSKYPGQVHDYTCKVDNIKDGKLYLSGLEEMGNTVLDHFKKCLEFQYPTDSLGVEPSLMEVLKMEHETFMFQRSQVNNCLSKARIFLLVDL